MKKLKHLIMAILLCSVSTSLIAQLSYGFRGGVTFPEVRTEVDGMDFSFEDHPGITFSMFSEWAFTDYFAVQPELVFIQKGMSVTDVDYVTGEKEKAELRFNYLEFPMLMKVKMDVEQFHLYLIGGPTFGYAVSGYEKYKGDKDTFDEDDWDELEMNRFEVGANFGGGFGVDVGPGVLFVDTRYGMSLSNLYNGSESMDVKQKNKGMIIGMGFMFRPR